MGKDIYIVLLEWYDEEFDNCEQESRQYFFDSVNVALDFVNGIVRTQKKWKEFGCPKSIYLYKTICFYDTPYPYEYFSEENRYIAAWIDCHKYLKDEIILNL